jgi:hypothetical protein
MHIDKILNVIVAIPIVGVEERNGIDAQSDRVIATDKSRGRAHVGMRFWQADVIDCPIIYGRIWNAIGYHDVKAWVSLLCNAQLTMMQYP